MVGRLLGNPGAAKAVRGVTHKIVVAIVLIAAFLWWRSSSPAGALAKAGWINEWDKAVQMSRSSGKPTLALFTADWCPACREFESNVLSRADVKAYLKENVTAVVVDLTDSRGPNNRLAARCGIQAIPTLILYNKSGTEVARSHGMPADAFVAWIDSDGKAVRLDASNSP